MIVYVYNRKTNEKIAKFTNVDRVTKNAHFFTIYDEYGAIYFPRPETKLVIYDF